MKQSFGYEWDMIWWCCLIVLACECSWPHSRIGAAAGSRALPARRALLPGRQLSPIAPAPSPGCSPFSAVALVFRVGAVLALWKVNFQRR